MTAQDIKTELKSILARHHGRSLAITARELAQAVDCDERRVRLIIRELIADGLPVASSTENPPGYFLVANREEARQYAQSIRGRLIEDALRRRDFRRAADRWLTPAEQGKLI